MESPGDKSPLFPHNKTIIIPSQKSKTLNNNSSVFAKISSHKRIFPSEILNFFRRSTKNQKEKAISSKKLISSYIRNKFDYDDRENSVDLTDVALFPIEIKYFELQSLLGVSYSNGGICFYHFEEGMFKLVKEIQENENSIKFTVNDAASKILIASDKTIKIFDFSSENQNPIILEHGCNELSAFDFHPTLQEIVFFAGNKKDSTPLFLWNYNLNEVVCEVNENIGKALFGFFGMKSDALYIMADDETFQAWNLDRAPYKLNQLRILRKFRSSVVNCVLDNKREQIFIATSNNNLFVYDINFQMKESLIYELNLEQSYEFLGFYCPLKYWTQKTNSNFEIKSMEDPNLSLTYKLHNNREKLDFVVFYTGNTLFLVNEKMEVFHWTDPKQDTTKLMTLSFPSIDKMKKDVRLGPILNIQVNSKETKLLATGNYFLAFFDLKNNCLLKNHEISTIVGKNGSFWANFFLNDLYVLILLNKKRLCVFDLKEMQLKKELAMNFQQISNIYNDFDSEVVFFVIENIIYSWRVDFSNKIVSETMKGSKLLFLFEFDIRQAVFLPKKQLCFLLFDEYEMNKILVYHLETWQLLKVMCGHEMNIKRLLMSKSSNIICSYCQEFFIVWNSEDFSENKRIKLPFFDEQNVYQIDENSFKLYVGLSNGSIYVFDIQKGCEEKIYRPCHLKPITAILALQTSLVTASKDGQLKLWDSRALDWKFDKNIEFDESSILHCDVSREGNKLVVVDQRLCSYYTYDIDAKVLNSQKDFEYKISSYTWNRSCSAIFIMVFTTGCLDYINKNEPLKNCFNINNHIPAFFGSVCLFNSKDTQLCLGTSNSYIVIFDVDWSENKMNIVKKLNFMKGEILALTFHPTNEELLCFSLHNHIKLISITSDKVISNFIGSSDSIYSIAFSSNGSKMCSSGKESYVRVWDTFSGEELYKLLWKTTFITESIFSEDDTQIYCCGLNWKLIVWDLRSKSALYAERDEGVKYNSVCYNKQNNLIITAGDNLFFKKGKQRLESLIQIQCLKILQNYLDNFEELLKKISITMINQLALNFIEPYHFSLLHTLLYLGKIDEFGNFIEVLRRQKTKFVFFSDFKGKNAIDILVEKKQFGMLNKMVKYLIDYPPDICDCSDSFNESLLDLLNHKLTGSQFLLSSRNFLIEYNFKLFTPYFPECIKKSSHKRDLTFQELQSIYPNISKKENEDKFMLKLVDIPNAIHPTSKFLSLLLKNFNADDPIFLNEIVVNSIEYKWEIYGFMIYCFTLIIFIISLVLISVNSLYFFEKRDEQKNSQDFIGSIVLNCLLIVIWLIPNVFLRNYSWIFSKEMRFKFSLWNIIDMMLTVFLSAYVGMDLAHASNYQLIDSANVKIIHSITLFLFWINLLSFGRAFEGTGFMLRILIQVLKDVKNFVIIVVLLICAFASSGIFFF